MSGIVVGRWSVEYVDGRVDEGVVYDDDAMHDINKAGTAFMVERASSECIVVPLHNVRVLSTALDAEGMAAAEAAWQAEQDAAAIRHTLDAQRGRRR